MKTLAMKAWRWLSHSATSDSDGQALVEYSLIILLVVIACVAVVTTMGETVRDVLWGQVSQLPF
jgi:Flp pilus assembly pilin Flp